MGNIRSRREAFLRSRTPRLRRAPNHLQPKLCNCSRRGSFVTVSKSNMERNADVERALELGATTYLVKMNYKLEEVVEKVKNALQEK